MGLVAVVVVLPIPLLQVVVAEVALPIPLLQEPVVAAVVRLVGLPISRS